MTGFPEKGGWTERSAPAREGGTFLARGHEAVRAGQVACQVPDGRRGGVAKDGWGARAGEFSTERATGSATAWGPDAGSAA